MTFINTKRLIAFFQWVLILGICFILQLFLMPNLAINGIVPNLLLALIILSALLFGLEIALPIAVVFTFVMKGFLPDGYFFLSWLLAPFIALATYPQLGLNRKTVQIIQVLACTLYVEILNAFFLSMSYGSQFLLSNYLILLISPLLNALLAIPLSFVLQKVFDVED